ncbi:MAG TPA: hypothetical protein VLA43_05160 [Longimicrobiales bacterium]|nr:hypothetical protein [Longimicrobiales bacterium]
MSAAPPHRNPGTFHPVPPSGQTRYSAENAMISILKRILRLILSWIGDKI